MDDSEAPITHDLVLVGGGHSHLAVLKMFGMDPIPGVQLTLVTRDLDMSYSGMLPGLIAGHYDFDEAHVDLRRLARFADARLYHTEAIGFDLEEGRVHCRDRPPIDYDLLSVNIGSTPRTEGFPGADEYATPVKPIDALLDEWEHIRRRILERKASETTDIAVVGAGAGGTELTLATQHRLHQDLEATDRSPDNIQFHLFSADDTILPNQPGGVQRRFRRVLGERDVDIHTNTPIVEVEPDVLHADGGDTFAYDEVFWVTNASAPDWIEESGLATDDKGFIEVDDYLRSTSHDDVFAAGDIASMTHYDRPKSGVFAVRQGKPLENNLRRTISGSTLRSYTPQTNFLQIISTGDRHAVATRNFWSFEGDWVWNLKDWIDQRWMEKWHDLPEMGDEEPDYEVRQNESLQELSEVAMRCGGCGAKIGSSVLDRVLERLDPVDREDVRVGLNEPDDAAIVDVPEGESVVHTVDFFRAFVDDPYLLGRIAANHALGDVFAMNAAPQSALALCTVPYASEPKVAEQLYQLMSGAVEVLNETNTALVGGHSAEGAELAFGLEVNATGPPDELLRKGGLHPGDHLVLTKPVGTGTLFAADMRHKAKGRWIHEALDSMAQLNDRAASIVAKHGAQACTDVTGFGLLGHLVEMTRPSKVDAVVDLESLPILTGAMDTIEAGIFSSLQPDNVRLRKAVRNQEDVVDHDRYPLLFDPQTAGGLLAGVPGENVDACLQELREAGYDEACVVGRIEPLSDDIQPIEVRSGELPDRDIESLDRQRDDDSLDFDRSAIDSDDEMRRAGE